jgi:PAS domain-containing protein
MNGLGSPTRNRYLILDDQAADGALLRQLLLVIDPSAEVTCHYSNQGLLPESLQALNSVFLAEGYAQSAFLPLVQLLQLKNPALRIVLCGRAPARSQQDLMRAAAAGASDFIEKDQLSVASLAPLLSDSPQQLVTAPTAPVENPAAVVIETSSPAPSSANNDSDALLEKLHTGIIVLKQSSTEWHYLHINAAAARLEGLDSQKLENEALNADDFGYQNFDLPEAVAGLEGGSLRSDPVLTLDSNGQPHWREIMLSQYGDRVIMELRDITAATLASAEAAEYDTLWEDLGRSLPAFCLTLNEEICVDQQLAGDWSQLTAKPETLPGTTLGDLFGEELQAHAQRVLNTGKSITQTLTLERPQGQLSLQLTIAPMRSSVGMPRRLVLLAHDISEQRIMLESLTADYQAVSEVLQNAPFGVAIKDLDGRYERVNSYFEMLCAERTDTIIGQTDTDIFGNELQSPLQDMEQRLVDSGDIQQQTLPLPEAESKQRYRIIKIPLHQNREQLRAIASIVLPVQIVTAKGKNKKDKKKQASE